MDGLEWWLTQQPGAAPGMLLLVAVDAAPRGAGAYPCRVVGAVSPLSGEKSAPAQDEPARISRLLAAIGIPVNLLGCAYLQTALALVLADAALGRSLSRTLYPRVAQAHHTTASSVERAIRHAIAATWARSGGSGYRSALGRLASSVADRPTNAEFISQTAECLRLGAP